MKKSNSSKRDTALVASPGVAASVTGYPSLQSTISALTLKAETAPTDFMEPIYQLVDELTRIEQDLRHLESLEDYQKKLKPQKSQTVKV